jgi:hypothetical protein
METKLTGLRRFRIGFFGVVILQVQYVYEHMDHDGDIFASLRWRDAKPQDITEMTP